ncbi:NAD(P)/FAD-dependent oxidoreductase [Flavobacterium sp. CS20]|uniref:FAD-dependent oxidoreductase n=1 Tax=Flavobacterium sp. CS20 TaxID=2775246 RepID=UPI001B3A0461|nr:NAD(P)/FAD-dependent oxidoreductase [Flavobacterium sp. CS20]QTY27283.1 FAD-dependent monooxygenase [Flavobacterium sp. CS20]
MQDKHLLIVGAGLCGSLLALKLAQHGYKITLIEKRLDLRSADISAGRSINLAFSDRGIKGIKRVGLEDKVKSLCIPMRGRMLHDKESNTKFSAYSGQDDNYINSISRSGLNALLLDEIEKHDNVKLIFQVACQSVDVENAKANFKNEKTDEDFEIQADYIIGTDGAGSVVRQALMKNRDLRFSFSQNFLTHGYKELSISPKDGQHQIYKNALHIWPRGENMLIALPNLDGSFTVTLFLAYEGGQYNFNNLTTPEIVEEYFQKDYPDALELMPHLATEFFENPTAALGTVRCSPWTYKKTLIMGDLAHAIVPFYGQGMNASFEDVAVFDDILQETNFDLDQAFQKFSQNRKQDADGIADLALDNFHEMKAHTAQELFLQKRELELAFEKEFPNDYASKYSLVTFNENIGYQEAKVRGRVQDKVILYLLKEGHLPEHLSLKEKLEIVKKQTSSYLKDEVINV